MESSRLDMRRIMPGLHAGDMIRAERKNDGHWAFDMKMRRISEKGPWWFEPDNHGPWQSIGPWPTLERGRQAAERLISGTHYWDQSTLSCKPYNDAAYAAIRGD